MNRACGENHPVMFCGQVCRRVLGLVAHRSKACEGPTLE